MKSQNPSVYLFGNTGFLKELSSCYKILGIVDEVSDAREIHGIPCVNLDEIPKGTPIINCVVNSRTATVEKRLQKEGFSQQIFIGQVISNNPELFSNHFLRRAQIAMSCDAKELLEQSSMFADQQSRDEFEKIIQFRCSLDIAHLRDFDLRIDEQYFEPFMSDCGFRHLIDGGPYDGADTLRFANLFPDYKRITAVEPSRKAIRLLSKNLNSLERFRIVNACLGEQPGTVGFSGDGMSACIDPKSPNKVDMVTLDSLHEDGRTLVKLDIEGAETPALRGARECLADPNYSFAISAYHLPHDFLDILRILRESPIARDFYFRHYSTGFCESILFAI